MLNERIGDFASSDNTHLNAAYGNHLANSVKLTALGLGYFSSDLLGKDRMNIVCLVRSSSQRSTNVR